MFNISVDSVSKEYEKLKDLERQKNIIEYLNPYMFIRYDEVENRLYDVLSGKELM